MAKLTNNPVWIEKGEKPVLISDLDDKELVDYLARMDSGIAYQYSQILKRHQSVKKLFAVKQDLMIEIVDRGIPLAPVKIKEISFFEEDFIYPDLLESLPNEYF
jgi:hypothetical protein